MSKQSRSGKATAQKQALGQRSLTSEEVKTRLREQGTTLKAWAAARGYPYETVSQVVRGINRGTFGMGHRIACELGLK